MTPRWLPSTLLLSLVVACASDDGQASSTTGSSTTGGATDSGTGGGAGTNADTSGSVSGPTSGPGGTTEASGNATGSGGTGAGGTTGSGECSVADVVTEVDFDAMFLHKDDPACSGAAYSYQGLLDAAADYPMFGCEGDPDVRGREVAAFLAQISHETTGGWATAPDGPHAWGLCFIEEVGCENNACPQYCDANNQHYPCAAGKTYHGRGAIQLSWNYNYGQAGDALGVDLLGDPDLVALDSELAIQTALWFWMTEQLPKPSAHDVMVGNWIPSAQDQAAGRLPGFGMTTNIINGGLECGQATPAAVEDRVGFFERYTTMLGVTMGDNVYCDQMSPY